MRARALEQTHGAGGGAGLGGHTRREGGVRVKCARTHNSKGEVDVFASFDSRFCFDDNVGTLCTAIVCTSIVVLMRPCTALFFVQFITARSTRHRTLRSYLNSTPGTHLLSLQCCVPRSYLAPSFCCFGLRTLASGSCNRRSSKPPSTPPCPR